MTNSGSSGEGVAGNRRDRFNSWRHGRPFAGGALLILASFVIAWMPIHIAPETILIGKALTPIGLLFAALVFLCGMFALSRPALADIFGIFGVVFSIFSLYGALGGLFVGLVLGIIGGVLCYAWEDEDERESGGSDGKNGSNTAESEKTDFDFGADSAEEDSGGLFGSRSVRSVTERTTAGPETTDASGRTASVAMLVVTVVVLGAFAHPFVAAVAGQSFPEQAQVEGTVVVAQQFAGTSYNHENVTTDTSDRTGVPAARLSFRTASIQDLTIYKNFRDGAETPFYLKITGTSADANGLSMTTSEIYFAKLGIGKDPVVIPAARKKWTTCPGKDFLLRVGDLGPLPDPPVDASGVVANTHRMTAGSITIENLKLTMKKGTKSTSVAGTPECTTNPIEPVLELFTANALSLLTDEGVIPPTVVTNGTITDLTAPANVTQGETFDVNATVTNTGYINGTKTIGFQFDNETGQAQNVTLGPGESTTVTFADIETANKSEGTYSYGVFTENASATGTIEVINETIPTNATANETTTTAGNTTNTTATNTTTDPTPTITQRASNSTNDTASATSTATSGSTIETTTAPQTQTTTTPTTTPEPTTVPEPTTTQTATTSTATPMDGTNTTATDETITTPTATPTTTSESTTTTNSSAAQPSLRIRR